MHLPDFLTTGRPSCTPDTAALFWSREHDDEQAAKALCHACPLLAACQTWAIDEHEQWGTWGGLTATERLQLHRGRGWWLDHEGRIRQPCGSDPAYREHLKYRETPCGPCTDAKAQASAERRAARQQRREARDGASEPMALAS